jgi:hypothetical protein
MVGHASQEFTYVLDSSIEVVTQLYRAVTLDKGDFIYLDSPMPNAFLCTSKGACNRTYSVFKSRALWQIPTLDRFTRCRQPRW